MPTWQVLQKKLAIMCILLLGMTMPAMGASAVKRRILVIPFDNMVGNKNYDWMSESFSENLKTELLKSGDLVVMDATMLRKINPDLQFSKLTDVEATELALKLNCEAAIIGRYVVTKKGGKDNALIMTEGVDAISGKSVLVKSQYADLDGSIFATIQSLAEGIAKELAERLPPLIEEDTKRDAKLERLILRLENPPKGFLDSITISGNGAKAAVTVPEFDIDTFEYEVYVPAVDAKPPVDIDFKYSIWGKKFNPLVTGSGVTCDKNKCRVEGQSAVLVLAKDNDPASPKYRLKFRFDKAPDVAPKAAAKAAPAKSGRSALWATLGYPLEKSLAAFGDSNPAIMAVGQPLPLDSMRGLAAMELGYSPGWGQFLPAAMRWSLATQYFYGNGNFSESTGQTPTVNMLSAGGGFRVDRVFMLGSWYGVAPLLGFYVHYQRYYRSFSSAYLNAMALVPEFGVNQYLRFGPASRWQLMLSTIAGSFIYSGQNLSYVRVSLGIEYAF